MANEFKIRKGLIVEGASGGTVVDVQGSQGQLFSVTDDLSGSIFAVSDISGVPILDINSNGTSYFDGSVGIGTESPSAALHVYDSSFGEVKFERVTGYSGLLHFGFPSGLPSIRTSGNFAIKASNTWGADFYINSTGNVGIGTTSPGAKLHVAHSNSSVYSTTSPSGDLVVSRHNTSNVDNQTVGIRFDTTGFAGTTTGQAAIQALQTSNVSSADLAFLTRNNATFGERMRITSSGNVGIGTDSPTEKLSISGAKNTPIIHLGSTTSNSSWVVGDKIGAIEFGSGDSSGAGAGVKASISYEVEAGTTGSTNSMVFRSAGTSAGTNNTERMRITASGNVGIGTTSPVNKLNVEGDIGYTGVIGQGSIYGNAANSSYANMQLYNPATGYSTFNNQSYGYYFLTGGGTKMTILNNGNVGINTTSPDFKLDVDGTFGVSDLPFNTDSVSVLVADETIGAELMTNGDFATDSDWIKGTGWTISGGTANKSAGSQSDLDQYSVTTLGNSYKVELTASNITAGSISVRLGTSAANAIGSIDANGTYAFYGTALGDLRLRIRANATFNGSIDNISVKQVTSASNQIQKRELGTGAFGPTPVGAYLPLAAGSSYPLTDTLYGTKATFGDTNIDVATVTIEGGLVGILDIWRNGTNASYQAIRFRDDTNANTEASIGWASNQLRLNGTSTIVATTGGSERMRIDSDGNVGIGTTSPGAKLDVDGSVKASTFFSHKGTYTGNTYTDDWQKVYSHNWSKFSFSAFTLKVLAGGQTANDNINADVHINYKMQNGAYRVYANIVNYGSEALLAENFKINLSVTSTSSGSWTIWHKVTKNYQTPYYTIVGSGIGGTWYSETPVASPTGDDDTWSERIIINSMSVDTDDSGNVGIGTTSPSTKLHVAGATDANIIRIENTTTALSIGDAIGAIQFFNNDTTDYSPNVAASIYATAGASGGSGQLHFRTKEPGTEGDPALDTMSLLNNGNVGIGATSPGAKLEVVGGSGDDVIAKFKTTGTGTSDYSEIHILNNNNDKLVIGSIGSNYTNSNWAGMRYVYANSGDLGLKAIASDGNVRIYAGSSSAERMRIDSAGNVGIGTTSPGAKLEVSDTTTGIGAIIGNTTHNSRLQIYTDAVGKNSEIWFGDAADDDIGKIDYDHANNSLSFSTNASEKMRIASNGNVGIGTDSPTSYGSTARTLEVRGNTGTGSGLIRVSNADNSVGTSLYSSASAGTLSVQTNHPLTFATNNTEAMRITSSGNVGIGTTSPTQPFQVDAGSSIASFRSVGSGQNNKELLIQTGGDRVILDAKNADDGTATSLTLELGNSEKVRLTTTGLGIGTTSPDAKLHVHNGEAIIASSTDGVKLSYSNGNSSGIIDTAFSDNNLEFRTNGTAKMWIANAGNVGIGTSTPNAKLDVQGTQGQLFSVTDDLSGDIFSVADISGVPILNVNSDGNTSINGVLTIEGAAPVSTSPMLKLNRVSPVVDYKDLNSSGFFYLKENFKNASNTVIGSREVWQNPGGSGLYYNFDNGTNGGSQHRQKQNSFHWTINSNSEKLTLHTNGYIGVNKTQPDYQLDVTGNGRFTSTVTATNFILSSDKRLKENVEKVCDNRIKADWKTFELKTEKGQKRYGVIAQELEKTNPEFVREDNQGFKSVAYIDLLIAKIAELEARLEKLEK